MTPRELRQQAAIAVLQGLAEGLRTLMSENALACTAPAFAGGGVVGAQEVVD